jgi:uncharacterized SAM-binding protein YcdF (DUF218 family)
VSALSWCGLAVVLLVVALWIVGFALLMTRAALAQAQLEAEQLDYDWRSAMQKMQRRGRHDL